VILDRTPNWGLVVGVVPCAGHGHDAQLLGGERPDDRPGAEGHVYEGSFDAGRRTSHSLPWRQHAGPGPPAEGSFSFSPRRARSDLMKVPVIGAADIGIP
jgi:hypothetical protein